jgi:hypothetical protein
VSSKSNVWAQGQVLPIFFSSLTGQTFVSLTASQLFR